MTDRTVCLTIDGQEVKCPDGSTVYEAATAAGIHIPTFCHYPKLTPVGACRTCVVEIEGVRGLQTSCTTPVRDGMAVKVHTSPAATKQRKAILEFLLTNHPLDCPVCDKGGECPLQNQTLLDGPGQSRYIEAKRHKNKRYPLGELIVLDQERCVLCWRCIRFLDEWPGDHELDLIGRGADTRIDTFPGLPLSSKWQGNTIDICPVGALTSRVFRFEARVWELTNTSSICPMCAVGCNILLGVKNSKLRRITPRENTKVNDAWICDKGRFAHSFVDHPDRLKAPLIRRNGELQPVSWDEALNLIAQRFHAIIQEHGPQAIAGLGSTRVTNEANYLFQRFMRTVIGTNNVDHLGRLPAEARPLTSLPGLENKDVIFLAGIDPSTEAPLVELWIKKAVLRRGAKVVVANPRKIELSDYGGLWLGYRPGSEVALIYGIARAILDAGMGSRTARVTNMDDFRTWLKPFSPEQVERITGAPAGTLRQAAETLARSEHPMILYGPGWMWNRREQTNLAALSNLALLLGGIEEGFVVQDNNTLGALAMGVVPDLYPGQQPFNDDVRSRLSSVWGGKLSPAKGLDFDGMMSAGQEGSLKGMWIMGADPASECPIAGGALGQVSFLVAQDLFMTDTAQVAEVVLPAASFAETEGSYINLTGRLQIVQAAMRPPGQARPDWWIITELARRMVDSKRQKTWALSPADVLSEISRVLPGYRGATPAAIDEEGYQPPAPQAAVRRAFVPCEPGEGLEPLGRKAEQGYPLILFAGRLLYDRGTLLRRSGRIQKLVPEAYVMIHPDEAARLGLEDGENVSLVSAKGRLQFTLRVSDEVAPGVAFAPLNLSDAPLSVLLADHAMLPRVEIVK